MKILGLQQSVQSQISIQKVTRFICTNMTWKMWSCQFHMMLKFGSMIRMIKRMLIIEPAFMGDWLPRLLGQAPTTLRHCHADNDWFDFMSSTTGWFSSLQKNKQKMECFFPHGFCPQLGSSFSIFFLVGHTGHLARVRKTTTCWCHVEHLRMAAAVGCR